jgi:hypothetical protein
MTREGGCVDALLSGLRQRRDELKARSAGLAKATRRRGLGALAKVRGGALDWRRALAAQQKTLGPAPEWFRFAKLQRVVLSRVDRALAIFGDRVRFEMTRLKQRELPAPPKKRAGAKRKGALAAPAPKRLVFPIADYDALSAKDVIAELARLSEAQCKTVYEHERTHRKRKTVLKALSARLPS